MAIAAAIVVEVVLGGTFYRKWQNLASAGVSGISVGILIRSPPFWPFASCAAISRARSRSRPRHRPSEGEGAFG
jgi:hypothetical protein